MPQAAFGPWGIDLQAMNSAIAPGDDFYRFVNSGWLEATALPDGRGRWSAFNALARDTQTDTKKVIDQALAAKAAQGSPLQLIGDFYRAFTNRKGIETRGLAPIQGDLDRIEALKTHEDIARWMADPRSHAIVGIYAWLSAENPKQHVIYLDQIVFNQGMLGLPSKTHYLSQKAPYPENRGAYTDHIETILAMVGRPNARTRAEAVMALETALAERSWDTAKLRDRLANIHLMPRAQLEDYAPGFPWRVFLQSRGVDDTLIINLGTDTAVRAAAELFAETQVATWRDYLTYHWVGTHQDLLPSSVSDAWFAFYGTQLRGLESRTPLERRALRYINRHLGHQIGQIYTQQHFPEAHRAKMELLVAYLRSAFQEKLAETSWMDETTRAEALKKITTMELAVGYPKIWRDRAGLIIRADDPVGNYQRILQQNWDLERALLGGPYPPGIWWMNAQTVDASFSPQLNRITFPAGILQPPFFDPHADFAVNFGAIGAVIGHEMGHGFDDQGSGFDAQGRARQWWSEAARTEYGKRVEALAEQYSQFRPLPDTPIDGAQTVGENMGDLIGVSVAFRALELFAKEKNLDLAEERDGFSGRQRFFLAWAQAHRALYTEKQLREELVRGFHSPHEFRVNGVVRNMDAWYQAFGVATEHALFLPPEKRVRFW